MFFVYLFTLADIVHTIRWVLFFQVCFTIQMFNASLVSWLRIIDFFLGPTSVRPSQMPLSFLPGLWQPECHRSSTAPPTPRVPHPRFPVRTLSLAISFTSCLHSQIPGPLYSFTCERLTLHILELKPSLFLSESMNAVTLHQISSNPAKQMCIQFLHMQA